MGGADQDPHYLPDWPNALNFFMFSHKHSQWQSDDSCGDSTSVDSDNEAVEDAGGGLLVINEERDDSEAIDISVWLVSK